MKTIIKNNHLWAEEKCSGNLDYFKSLSEPQHPKFLWIGCSDSRVPPEIVTNSGPGELFVHRNVANLIDPTDLNLFSVVQYAVEHLKVPKIVVCGHYDCGGVKAALTENLPGALGGWLYRLKGVVIDSLAELEKLDNEKDKVNRMVELNTLKQLDNLGNSPVIREFLHNGGELELHATVFDMHNGHIKVLESLNTKDGKFVPMDLSPDILK